MNMQVIDAAKLASLEHPAGDPLRLNRSAFVAIDRHRDAPYNATYRPQALYSRAENGFQANNETLLLHEVATNLPIHRPDTGPTDFHMHLPPGGFQFVLVTSGMFTFDYDGRLHYVGPGAVMLQSAIVHRQLFYTWSGLDTEANLATPQSAVPDAMTMGYSGKFLEAFITDPTSFPNPTIVPSAAVNEAETPRTAFGHALHDRPTGADFWVQDALSLDALYKPLPAAGTAIKSDAPVYVRDLGIEAPSGNLVTGHILATDPRDHSLLPKSSSGGADPAILATGAVAMYRVIRGTAAFKDSDGKTIELGASDVITTGANAATLVAIGEDSQVLRLGLLDGLENLRKWTPAQRDAIDGLGGQIIARTQVRPLRLDGNPVGYLYT
ncbi:MAG: hypothetical protein JNJ97_07035 [Alphaproteobacteria bacterium]|nr:hypothetical protein [Alphaproteobacteria bacterium]MCA0448304.1 hypothetical protein [Pseudomonadota bacterium]